MQTVAIIVEGCQVSSVHYVQFILFNKYLLLSPKQLGPYQYQLINVQQERYY